MRFLRRIFAPDDRDFEMYVLRKRVETCEHQIEKIMELVNNLATFDEAFSRELRSLSSHVSLVEASMVDARKDNLFPARRRSNGDDIIN